ncbi:helix-turn-helix transcriptional regulator [Sphingomonas bacterium]|uniref:helix-turn-helix transcriptional regulator n=1 Tax=Sphingomonas bacterium TaxID=1895847 RepID=UPI0015755FBF|nr:YafY family protein [Sphingomonas bacterium]
MTRRAERLFQIIQVLRRSTRPVTGAALAAELEVSTRTVYRDIADLMARRVPIAGEPGLGYLLAADYDMPPLMLTPAEPEAVVLGAQWVAGRGDPLLSLAAHDVLAKIAAAVPAHLHPLIAQPSTATQPSLDMAREVVDPARLREAIRRGRKLRLRYCAGDGARTERTVWPVVLGYSASRRVLIAWCERRQAFRHFRTDRMDAADLLDQPIGEARGALLRRWQAWRAATLAAGERRVEMPAP